MTDRPDLIEVYRLNREAYLACADAGVSHAQWVSLATLGRRGMSSEDMSEAMGVKWTSVSRLLRSLEEKGLAERARSLRDRRMAIWRCTVKGAQLAESLRAWRAPEEKQ